MKRLFAAIALVAWSFVCFAQSRTTWDGFVTDTHCGTNCQRTSDMKPNKECVRLCVRKFGDSISVDFTGSDPAVAGPMNAPLTVTARLVSIGRLKKYFAAKYVARMRSRLTLWPLT